MLTVFLASLWGPVLLALGIGFFTSTVYYKKMYVDMDKQALSLLALSILLIPLGIIQVMAHNVWSSGFTAGLISFLGWGMLAKGLVFAIFPKLVNRAGEYEARHGFLPFAAALMAIVGAYLTWFAFF